MLRRILCVWLMLLLLLGPACAETSVPPTGSGSGRLNFHALYEEDSGAVYFVLAGTLGYPAFYRYHPRDGWEKIAQEWGDVSAVVLADGWLFYERAGRGFSPDYTFVKAVRIEDGKKRTLVDEHSRLIGGQDGSAVVGVTDDGVYRIAPDTVEKSSAEWPGTWMTQTGVTRRDGTGEWYFRPFGGEETPLHFTSDAYVRAIRPDCWLVQDPGTHSLTLWLNGEAVAQTADYDGWAMDDRYVVWYSDPDNPQARQEGNVTIWYNAEESVKQLCILDTLADGSPLYVEVPVHISLDKGVYLGGGMAFMFTDEDGSGTEITCIDLATGELAIIEQ